MKCTCFLALLLFATSCNKFDGITSNDATKPFFSATADGEEIAYRDCQVPAFEAVEAGGNISIDLGCEPSGSGIFGSSGWRVNILVPGTADGTYTLDQLGQMAISLRNGVYGCDSVHKGIITIRSGRYEKRVDDKYDEYLEGEFSLDGVEQMSLSPAPQEKQITNGRFHLRKRRG